MKALNKNIYNYSHASVKPIDHEKYGSVVEITNLINCYPNPNTYEHLEGNLYRLIERSLPVSEYTFINVRAFDLSASAKIYNGYMDTPFLRPNQILYNASRS